MNLNDLKQQTKEQIYTPNMNPAQRTHYLKMWHKAVERAKAWSED